MKQILFSLFLFISVISFSQTWSPPGATWYYTYWDPFGGAGYIKISYTGDTIINSQSVKKLEKFHSSFSGQTNQFNSIILGYEYTYEDNGVVYLWFNNNWDTLYNYNASIGESWEMANQPYVQACDSNSTLTVIDTGTTIINGTSLKYLVLNFDYGGQTPLTYSDTIIEKIGFINSYMFPYDYCNGVLDVNEGGPFRCYSDNNFPLFQPGYPYNCDFIVEIDEIELDSRYSIFPNPTNSSIMVERLSNNNSFDYSILSIEGKLLKQGTSSGEINIEELNDGIYFMRLNNSNNNSYLKFIKIK